MRRIRKNRSFDICKRGEYTYSPEPRGYVAPKPHFLNLGFACREATQADLAERLKAEATAAKKVLRGLGV